MTEPFRIGLLATAPSARPSRELLASAPTAIERGHRAARPRSRGVLTPLARRLRRDPRRQRPGRRAHGRPGAGARATCCARCAAGKHVVTANKQLLAAARRGAVGGRPRARRPAALRGRRRRRRARSSACCRSRWPPRTSSASTGSSTARRTSSSPHGRDRRDATPTRWPRPSALGYAEADPTEDVNGKDAAAKMAILARLAFDTPVHLDAGALRGHRAHHRRRHGVRARARPRAEADRHGRARRRRPERARAPGVPLRRPPAGVGQRPVQRRDDRVRGDHRDHAVRARAPAARRRRARCSATSSAR